MGILLGKFKSKGLQIAGYVQFALGVVTPWGGTVVPF